MPSAKTPKKPARKKKDSAPKSERIRKTGQKNSTSQESLFNTLIDNLPDRIYVKDLEGRKTISNRADWQASGGKRAEDVIGRSDFDTYPAEMAEKFWADD